MVVKEHYYSEDGSKTGTPIKKESAREEETKDFELKVVAFNLSSSKPIERDTPQSDSINARVRQKEDETILS